MGLLCLLLLLVPQQSLSEAMPFQPDEGVPHIGHTLRTHAQSGVERARESLSGAMLALGK
jgi:hypothetical protein